MKLQWLIMALTSVCLSSIALAQEPEQQQENRREQEPVYFPLFSEEMIQSASPEQSIRMRETEARNRQAFDSRMRALRDQDTAQKQEASTQAPRQDAETAPLPQRGKRKIFKWVDANGRVHFSDVPQGRNAKEINVGGAARIRGNPPPLPSRALETGATSDSKL